MRLHEDLRQLLHLNKCPIGVVSWSWTSGGFFSVFNTYLLAYGLADYLKTKFVLIGKDKSYFDTILAIENNSYYYPQYKHDIFGESCKSQMMNTLDLSLRLKSFVMIPSVTFDTAFNNKNKYLLNSDTTKILNYLNKLFVRLWILHPGIVKEIKRNLNNIFQNRVSEPYHAIHVRRGDKLIFEAKSVPIRNYLKKLNFDQVKLLYLATDDYQSLVEVKSEAKALGLDKITILSQIGPERSGYNQGDFNRMCEGDKKRCIVSLLTDFEILRAANTFVGSFSSNVSQIVHISRCGNCSFSVDNSFNPKLDPYSEVRKKRRFSRFISSLIGLGYKD